MHLVLVLVGSSCSLEKEPLHPFTSRTPFTTRFTVKKPQRKRPPALCLTVTASDAITAGHLWWSDRRPAEILRPWKYLEISGYGMAVGYGSNYRWLPVANIQKAFKIDCSGKGIFHVTCSWKPHQASSFSIAHVGWFPEADHFTLYRGLRPGIPG